MITYRPKHGDLGRLSFLQALEMHVAQVPTGKIAEAAGVRHPSVAKWRKRNQLTTNPRVYKYTAARKTEQ